LVGDEQSAWRWLARAEAGHYDDLVFLRSDPCFARLHGSPQWAPLLGRLFGGQRVEPPATQAVAGAGPH